MRTFVMGVVLSAAIISAGCGATRKVTSTVAPGPAITGATLQFMDRDHGKDASSAVDVWLLHGSNEMAHLHSVGDQIRRQARRLRRWLCRCRARSLERISATARSDVRLTPDGRDDWSFEPRLMLTFSDGTSRTYAWPQVMLDNEHPEVTLSLRLPCRSRKGGLTLVPRMDEDRWRTDSRELASDPYGNSTSLPRSRKTQTDDAADRRPRQSRRRRRADRSDPARRRRAIPGNPLPIRAQPRQRDAV